MNYPAAELRGIYFLNMLIEQFKLISINLMILPTLAFYISRYHFFITVSPNRIDIISTRPELTTPQYFLGFRMPFEYLFPCNTFYCLNNIPWTLHRHTLYQKMHMILINSNFYKMDLVSFSYPYACLFQTFRNFFCKNFSSIFCRANNVV